MSTSCLRSLWSLVLAALVAAQDPPPLPFEGTARRAMALLALEPREAVRGLLALADEVQDDPGREAVATALIRAASAARPTRPADAVRAARGALALRKEVCGDADHAMVAEALLCLSHAHNAARQVAAARRAADDALAMFERLTPDEPTVDKAAALFQAGVAVFAQNRPAEALVLFERAAGIQRAVSSDDARGLAAILGWVGSCHAASGRMEDALPWYQEAFRIHDAEAPDGDVDLVNAAYGLGLCLQTLGRDGEALQAFDDALWNLEQRPDGPSGADFVNVLIGRGRCLAALGRGDEAREQFVRGLATVDDDQSLGAMRGDLLVGLASTLHMLGRYDEALGFADEGLRLQRAASLGLDTPALGLALTTMAECLSGGLRPAEAVSYAERALAVFVRKHRGNDHQEVARALIRVSMCLSATGRYAESLPRIEAAVAMTRRLQGLQVRRDLASALDHAGRVLWELGRAGEALPCFEESLAVQRALYGTDDHIATVNTRNGLGTCLARLGRHEEALRSFEAVVALGARHGSRFDEHAHSAANNVAMTLLELGRIDQALPRLEAALAAAAASHPGGRHPAVVGAHVNLAYCLQLLGRFVDAKEHAMAALANSVDVQDYGNDRVLAWTHLARCLEQEGRHADAVAAAVAAVTRIEGKRASTRALSPALRQAAFDEDKRGGSFELLQRLHIGLGDAAAALAVAEDGRARDLVDRLLLGEGDLDAVARRARDEGKDQRVARVEALRAELVAARAERDRLLVADLSADAERRSDVPEAAPLRAATAAVRRLEDERARLVAEVLPVADRRTVPELRAALGDGECLLEFTVTDDATMVCALFADRPEVGAEIRRMPRVELEAQVARVSSAGLTVAGRGRDPEAGSTAPPSAVEAGRRLFAALFSADLWRAVQRCRRVWIVAHGALHRLPFEALVVGGDASAPSYWLDTGPAVSYVPSAHVVHWLAGRSRERTTPSRDLLALGDPSGAAPGGEPSPGSTAAPRGTSSVDAWLLEGTRAAERARRDDLPPLPGARAEVAAIRALWPEDEGSERRAVVLVGDEATERAAFDRAAGARFVHFACHGIADEYAGQSRSLLVLAATRGTSPHDDGLLGLDEILGEWGGRLTSTECVVLSACSTHVGPTHRDESPQALPLGFLLAGARSVVATLWPVDDAATRELMVAFYRHAVVERRPRLEALVAAKREARKAHADPRRWSGFVYLGSPD